MSNPLEGQDFTVNLITTEELSGATVLLWIRKPDLTLLEDITPTSINESTGIISYKIDDLDAIAGWWTIGGKIISGSGDISKINPPVNVKFDEDISLRY